MGQEINTRHFDSADFDDFRLRLEDETRILTAWFTDRKLSRHALVAGYEMEAWLIDDQSLPRPANRTFLEKADDRLLTTELARFNFEINTDPQPLEKNLLARFDEDFSRHWHEYQQIARQIDCRLISIGILPTLQAGHLTMKNISHLQRYRALNDQILKQRGGRPFELNINGHEALKLTHRDVMLEAASTSLQVHLQVPFEQAVRYYNAAIFISAPVVAISANSPFLFGRDLWAETRIPVFEQSVDVGGFSGAASGPVHRVSFGTGYARESVMECFDENLQHFPILLPMIFESEAEKLAHLSLHNGTIWRWNRPLIGFDKDGTPHLRIEHRVMSSGASSADNIANIAFFYGLIQYYASHETAPEHVVEFPQAKDNFYNAARLGLNAKIGWIDCDHCNIRHLILDRLIQHAESGLKSLNIDAKDIDYYLGIIQHRAEQEQTGSEWQRRFAQLHDHDMQKLTQTYYDNQQTGEPVHCWDFLSSM